MDERSGAEQITEAPAQGPSSAVGAAGPGQALWNCTLFLETRMALLPWDSVQVTFAHMTPWLPPRAQGEQRGQTGSTE